MTFCGVRNSTRSYADCRTPGRTRPVSVRRRLRRGRNAKQRPRRRPEYIDRGDDVRYAIHILRLPGKGDRFHVFVRDVLVGHGDACHDAERYVGCHGRLHSADNGRQTQQCPYVFRLIDDRRHELLLALHTSVVLARPRAEVPDSIHPEARVPQRLLAVEMLDARLQVDEHVDRLVEHSLLDINGHAAQGVDDGGKSCEIGLDRIVDAETRQQICCDGIDQQTGPAIPVVPAGSLVQLVDAVAGDRDARVTWKRQQAYMLRHRVQPHQHDRVCTTGVTRHAGVGPKQQDVDGFVEVWLRLERYRGHHTLRRRGVVDSSRYRVSSNDGGCGHST